MPPSPDLLRTSRFLWAAFAQTTLVFCFLTVYLEPPEGPIEIGKFAGLMLAPNALFSVLVARLTRLPIPRSTRIILAFALSESVALGGFIAHWNGATAIYIYAPIALSFLAHLANFPTASLLESGDA